MTEFNYELMKEDIIREYVQHHIDSFEDWDLYEEDGNPIVVKEFQDPVRYEDYDEAFDDLFPEIRDSVLHYPLFNQRGDYIGYLTYDQLEFMGLAQEYERKKKIFVGDITFEKLEEFQEKRLGKEELAGLQKHSRLDYTALATQIDAQIDIVDIISEAGLTVIPNGSNYLKTQEHDSLVIDKRKNTFIWWSRQPSEREIEKARKRMEKDPNASLPAHPSGGVVSFYQYYYDKDFVDAVKDLIKRVDPELEIEKPKRREDLQKLTFEQRHKSLHNQLKELNFSNYEMRAVITYLTEIRKIDPEIVKMAIDRNVLYQTHDDKGTYATFVGRNESGALCSVHRRSTYANSSFKCDFKDCDYSRGWFFDPDTGNGSVIDNTKKLLVFESNIEALSYMTILKMNGMDPKKFAYLSCGSITKTACVENTLDLYKYKSVCICFNDDFKKDQNPGREAAERLNARLEEKGYESRTLFPKGCNDWNDRLINMKAEIVAKKNLIQNRNRNGAR